MDEFSIINKYFKKLAFNNSGALNLCDDVFFDKSKGIVLSIDTYNEGVHFINNNSPDLLIKKIIRSSISDLLSKGVKPKFILISGSGNKNIFNKLHLAKLSKSIQQELKKFDLKLSGGDTTYSKKTSFTITSVGYANNIVFRNNAQLYDDVYVTGFIGDSFAGLQILKKKINVNKRFKKFFIKKYFLPNLPLNFSKYLFQYANTSMDVSDGLFSDLKKLIIKQPYGFSISLDKIPISKNLRKLIKLKKIDIRQAVSRGDDYQILFTSNKKNRKKLFNLSKRIKTNITRIGTINNNLKDFQFKKNGKRLKSFNFRGYLHNF